MMAACDTAEHTDKCGNPGRVNDIGGYAVLAELPLMGMCGMIGSCLNRQQSLTCIRGRVIYSSLHTKKTYGGLLFYRKK